MLTVIYSTAAEKKVAKRRQRLKFSNPKPLLHRSRKLAELSLEELLNYLILLDFKEWIKKVGAANKPGSVIDNHSSGTAVTDCL